MFVLMHGDTRQGIEDRERANVCVVEIVLLVRICVVHYSDQVMRIDFVSHGIRRRRFNASVKVEPQGPQQADASSYWSVEDIGWFGGIDEEKVVVLRD